MKDATCEVDGSKIKYCEGCDASEEAVIDAIGHSYGEQLYKKPTKDSVGGTYVVCANCGEIKWIEKQTFAQYVKTGVNATTITAKASASVKTETITVTWTKSAGYTISYYNVYRSTTGKDGSFKKIGTSKTKTYTDKTAKPGTKYYYRVRGVRTLDGKNYLTKLSNKPYAKIKKVTAAYVKESKMTIRSYYAGKAIKVTWTSPRVKVDGYEIWRSKTGKAGSYSKVYTTKNNYYTDTKLAAGAKRYYKVKAISGNTSVKNSDLSKYTVRTTKLARPAVTTANVTKTGKIKLTWKKVTGADKYQVWRATKQNGKYTLVKTVKTRYYTDTKAKAGTKYYYKVKAVYTKNTVANSALSLVKSRTCKLAQPVITLNNNTKGQIKVSWKKVTGATSYKVYRKAGNGKWKLVKTTTNRYFTNKSLKKGVKYSYKVMAVKKNKSAANSAYSAVKYKKCK